MVDEHEDQDGPRDEPGAASLEPPSLFRRRARAPKPPKAPRAPKAAQPVVAPEPVEAPTPPQPVAEPVIEPVAEPAPVPVAEPAPVVPQPAPEPVVTRVIEPVAPPEPAEAPQTQEPHEPRLTGPRAAVVAGLVVGALLVAGTAASLKVCDVVRGTETCGGSGYLFLIAILVVSALVGGALLRAALVPDPVPTAILAVGLLAVFSLLFLVGHLLAWWMVIVIPLVSVGAFALSHWVTTSFTDLDD